MNTELRRIGKALALYLRHRPELLDIRLDDDGFAMLTIRELAEKMNCGEDQILAAVEQDEKVRFEISGDRIRANYGHSVEQGKIMYLNRATIPPEELPERLYHGTKRQVLRQILQEGLLPRSRHFVHLTESLKLARVIGGRRKGETVLLEVQMDKLKEAGLPCWQAGPNIILTRRVPPPMLHVLP